MKPGSQDRHRDVLKQRVIRTPGPAQTPAGTAVLTGPEIRDITATVPPTSTSANGSSSSANGPTSNSIHSVEHKRLLIRKQLVILLHAIVCRRRDLSQQANNQPPLPPCNVPFCGLMKTVLIHLNSCKDGRNCPLQHCPSSRQILIHWKYCVKTDCPVCVSLRQVVPTSLLQIFPSNPLCHAEILQRVARQQQMQRSAEPLEAEMMGRGDHAVPELMEAEE